MKAWQREIREKKAKEGTGSMFEVDASKLCLDLKKAEVRRVSRETAEKIIIDYEWLGCMAALTTDFFGIYFDNTCGGVVTFSEPPSPPACKAVAGNGNAKLVKLLSRGACVHWTPVGAASKLIMEATKIMVKETRFRYFVAYADTRAGEIGTVYQACGWYFTGLTKSALKPEYFLKGKWRTDRSVRSYEGLEGHLDKLPQREGHNKLRYLYVGGRSKKEQKDLLSQVKYKILPYPKRETLESLLARAQEETSGAASQSSEEGRVQSPQPAPIKLVVRSKEFEVVKPVTLEDML